MLRKILFTALFFSVIGLAFTQQITRVAVVDLPRIYTAFFRESQAVREYERRVANFESEVERLTRGILEIRARHADAVVQNNENEIIRLEGEIHRREANLREVHQTRTAMLENERNQLARSSSFLNQVQDEIRIVAEREGFSIVLNLQNNPSLIWYTQTLDITDRVIQSLNARSR
ncbi:MAG: OmpH family outer membrane protein [Treponema sp.]|jgi:outer membrane protein|nr:OmpH family outer membrane protein [Treponema sp.]